MKSLTSAAFLSALLRDTPYRDVLSKLETAGGELWSTMQLSQRRHIEGANITLRNLTRAKLLGVKVGDSIYFPSVQFIRGTGDLPDNMKHLLARFGQAPGWVLLDWMVTPNPWLCDRAPCTLLELESERDQLMAAAARHFDIQSLEQP